jgi:hypothetical protein
MSGLTINPSSIVMGTALLSVALLSACGGSDEEVEPSRGGSLATLGAGAYQVRSSDGSNNAGLAFYSADGRALVALSSDGDGAAQRVLTRTAKGAIGGVDSTVGELRLSYEYSAVLPATAPTAVSAAGEYDSLIGNSAVRLLVGSDGALRSQGAVVCQIEGKLDFAQRYGDAAVAVNMTLRGCAGQADGSYRGLAYALADEAPARWHVLAENGAAVLDFVVYR